MSNEKNSSGQELRFTRLLHAPVQLVWKAWADPRQVSLWWGPDGFTNTIHKMEFKPGGKWNMTMYAPDGKSLMIKSVFREILKHKKIVYEQLNHFRYTATIEFEERDNKTFINWRICFASEEKLKEAATAYGVIQGFAQHTEKLEPFLHGQLKKTYETI